MKNINEEDFDDIEIITDDELWEECEYDCNCDEPDVEILSKNDEMETFGGSGNLPKYRRRDANTHYERVGNTSKYSTEPHKWQYVRSTIKGGATYKVYSCACGATKTSIQ